MSTPRLIAFVLPAAFAAFACGAPPSDIQVTEVAGDGTLASDSSDAATGPRQALLAEYGGGAAADDLPEGHPPLAGAEATALPPVAPGAGTGADALVWETPDGWISEPPASSMRRAQYRIAGEAGDAECVVFYFGPGQGGEPLANAQRWAAQFTKPDGSPALEELKTETHVFGGVSVLEVEVVGTYNPGTMSGATGGARPDSMLLGAIAQGPDANWFFKLTGPAMTVEAHREAFAAMVRSLGRGSESQ